MRAALADAPTSGSASPPARHDRSHEWADVVTRITRMDQAGSRTLHVEACREGRRRESRILGQPDGEC